MHIQSQPLPFLKMSISQISIARSWSTVLFDRSKNKYVSSIFRFQAFTQSQTAQCQKRKKRRKKREIGNTEPYDDPFEDDTEDRIYEYEEQQPELGVNTFIYINFFIYMICFVSQLISMAIDWLMMYPMEYCLLKKK